MNSALLIFSLFGFIVSLNASGSDWAHNLVGIPKHPDINYARLDNGFSYAWHTLPNPKTQDLSRSCQIRLHVAVGSLQEEANEQGMAHFLEHMAFKGSKNISDDLIKAMQEIGLTFGAHSSAQTSYSETVYKFDMKNSCTKERLEKILLAVRGIADGLLIKEQDVLIEKGVVDAEERQQLQQNHFAMKQMDLFTRAVPELSRMNALGTQSIRDQFNAARVRKFYEKWYIPQAMKLIVTSDLNEFDTLIKKLTPSIFADMKPGNHYHQAYLSACAINELSAVYYDNSMPFSISMAGRWLNTTITPRTLVHMVEHEKRIILTYILQKRLSRELGDECEGKNIDLYDQDLTNARSSQTALQEARLPLLGIMLSSMANSGSSAHEIALFETIVEDALINGFAPQEVAQAVTERIALLSNKTDALHEAILNDARGFIAPLSAEQIQIFIVPGLTTMDALEAQTLLKKLWNGSAILSSMGNTMQQTDTEFKAIIAAAKKQVSLGSKENTTASKTYAYKASQKGGVVLKQSTDQGVTTIVFANGLVLKIASISNKTVGQFQITIKTSALRSGPVIRDHHIANDQFLSSFKQIMGTKNHIPSELKQIFPAEYQDLSIRWDHEGLTLTSFPDKEKPRSLITQLELLAGYFSYPELHQKEFNRLKSNKISESSQFSETLFHGFQQQVFGPHATCNWLTVSPQEMRSFKEDDVMRPLQRLLLDGPLEMDIFGAESADDVIDAVARTFGALPERKAVAQNPTLVSEPQRPFMVSGIAMTIQAPHRKQANLLIYYPLSDVITPRLKLLETIVLGRVLEKARKEHGASYTVQGFLRTEKEHGVFQIMLDLDPKRAPLITGAIITCIDELAHKGPTEEELLRAKTQSGADLVQDITAEHIKCLAHGVVRRDLASYALATPEVTE